MHVIADAIVILRKEFAEVLKNRYILSTMISFPLVFSIVIPLIYLLTLPGSVSSSDLSVLGPMIPQGMTPRQALIFIIVQSNLPFYLMMPSVIPTLISSYSIVGEKKGGTLEPLLATPVSANDVLLGKSLAAVIPSVLITWASFFIYSALVDYMTFSAFGRAILPDATWLFTVFVTAPLLSLMAVYASVLVSSRINDIRAAQQISAVFVIPMMGVFVLQLFGYVSIDIGILAAASLGLLVLDVILIWAGSSIFRRDEILTKWA
jgi:ABC-2 type transport system permease protein